MLTVYTERMWFSFMNIDLFLTVFSSHFTFFYCILSRQSALFYLHQSSNKYHHLCMQSILVIPMSSTMRRKRECWSTLSGNWKRKKGKKRLQLTSVLSTHPFVQKDAVWPTFILPHLPRRLFSLLGKHLEKCMKLKKRGIYVNILHSGRGEE